METAGESVFQGKEVFRGSS
ncbi:hypothetical protein A6R68_19520 [Neotoma lepida]|uniref:Uncharacterized protein n=1 Tax=Neotoma lepida TaxID=56216 RepID=A0A1A6HIJ3_NEOLE|nr:hypothetical protein A6R68_19520 [Neotoma lepida]